MLNLVAVELSIDLVTRSVEPSPGGPTSSELKELVVEGVILPVRDNDAVLGVALEVVCDSVSVLMLEVALKIEGCWLVVRVVYDTWAIVVLDKLVKVITSSEPNRCEAELGYTMLVPVPPASSFVEDAKTFVVSDRATGLAVLAADSVESLVSILRAELRTGVVLVWKDKLDSSKL